MQCLDILYTASIITLRSADKFFISAVITYLMHPGILCITSITNLRCSLRRVVGVVVEYIVYAGERTKYGGKTAKEQALVLRRKLSNTHLIP
jgi:hypothetical protein